MFEVVLAVFMLIYGTVGVCLASSDEDTLLTLSEVEILLRSKDDSCQIKQMASKYMSKVAMQDLFHRLEGDDEEFPNVILTKTERINALMNEVFISEGEHPWSKDDRRVLYLMRAYWEQSIDSECFNEEIDDFPSEEWLNGAAWVMRQKE
ncbi:MAG: hypothetical protein ACKUBY_00330 [Candidatus Moraniibacteriota bacterium]